MVEKRFPGATKVFFSCETSIFAPGTESELISIGMISEQGHCFYGEFTDIPGSIRMDHPVRTVKTLQDYTDEWAFYDICEYCGVLSGEFIKWGVPGDTRTKTIADTFTGIRGKGCVVINDRKTISKELSSWFNTIGSRPDSIVLIGDNCFYDTIALHRLFDQNGEWPVQLGRAAHDLCQDLSERGKRTYTIKAPEHTALYHAEMVREAYYRNTVEGAVERLHGRLSKVAPFIGNRHK